MKPPPFDYIVAATLDEALDCLSRSGEDVVPIAGGQTLAALLALRLARPATLLDINRIPELSGITDTPGRLMVKALTRQNTIATDPLVARMLPALAVATRLIGHFQTRNRGTIGGSLALGDPASEYPAFALALGAEIVLQSKRGERLVRARDFFEDTYVTVRAPDELITGIAFPVKPTQRIVIDEIARRRGDFALTGIVVALDVIDNQITDAAISWFSMGPTPVRAPSAEDALRGEPVDSIDVAAVAAMAVADTDPFNDTHATATYRRSAGVHLANCVLSEALRGGSAY